METIVDRYSGFILPDKDSKPKVALHIENAGMDVKTLNGKNAKPVDITWFADL